MGKNLKHGMSSVLVDIFYKFFVLRYHFKIMTPEETVQMIVSKKISVARFGDGEFKWLLKVKQDSFQDDNDALSYRLSKIIKTNPSNCLLCVPEILMRDNCYNKSVKDFWHKFVFRYGRKVVDLLSKDVVYGDTNFTRWYRSRNLTIVDYEKTIFQIKQIWDKRKVLIVEGELTRFGVGNDLLDNAKSIERIIAPSKNAFSYYDEILRLAKKHGEGKLVLAALGPTATVLAYDLSEFGIQAIDIGHLDIEYEWYLRGSHTKKVKIPGKYVNEAGGVDEEMEDKTALKNYTHQIVARVGVER